MKTMTLSLPESHKISVHDCWVESIDRKRNELILTFDEDGGFAENGTRYPNLRMIFVLSNPGDSVYVKKNIIRSSHTREKYIPFDKFRKIVHKHHFCIEEIMLGYHFGSVEIRGIAPFNFEISANEVKEIRYEY